MGTPMERPDKPESEFTEEDWHAVRFRNVLKMCMNNRTNLEPMREKDWEILESVAKKKLRRPVATKE
jgi:hypothetical protein